MILDCASYLAIYQLISLTLWQISERTFRHGKPKHSKNLSSRYIAQY